LFHIDSPSFQLETIQTAARSLSKDEKGRLELAKWAKEACDDAYAKDNYAAARELYQIALSLARAANDRDLLREVMSRFTGIENARREYAQIAKVIESLEAEPDDPQKNLLVGRYFCFVKEDWVQGLTFLAKGPDRRLAELAADDQALPIDPLDQVKLGDAWWSVAEDYADQQQKAIQRRSAWWYRQAVDNLPGGLAKVKAEIRLKELEKTSIQKSDRTPLLFGRDE
jgi:hypothetical protein